MEEKTLADPVKKSAQISTLLEAASTARRPFLRSI
jgi:hypothetical protein